MLDQKPLWRCKEWPWQCLGSRPRPRPRSRPGQGRGRGRGQGQGQGRGRGRERNQPVEMSVDDLNNDLDNYHAGAKHT
uniref:Chromatin target of PRMT1 protein C-terminal domain-containing protein n=1 Tax=Fagus sylvatica TaxID=28930 RepID=A0A2N9ETB9_FAGSY